MAEEKRVTEINFRLEVPLEYGAANGEMASAQFITLRAPTSRNRDDCADLKQFFFRALPAQDEDSPDQRPDAKPPSGQEVMTMIAMSKDVELKNMLEIASNLFTKGKTAWIDGEIKLTKPLMDEMDNDDFERMVGEYLVGFILRSALKSLSPS